MRVFSLISSNPFEDDHFQGDPWSSQVSELALKLAFVCTNYSLFHTTAGSVRKVHALSGQYYQQLWVR